jgi:hypothetical protein
LAKIEGDASARGDVSARDAEGNADAVHWVLGRLIAGRVQSAMTPNKRAVRHDQLASSVGEQEYDGAHTIVYTSDENNGERGVDGGTTYCA